jgi:hypothetical protein
MTRTDGPIISGTRLTVDPFRVLGTNPIERRRAYCRWWHGAAPRETCDVLRVAGTGELVALGAVVTHFGAMNEVGMSRDESREVGRKMMREHRVVVLPQYQGLAVGLLLSDTIGATWCATLDDDHNSHRYYSKTTHPRFGRYREANRGWRATLANQPAAAKKDFAFVHEYSGPRYAFGAGEKRRAPVAMFGGAAKKARAD